MAREDVAGTPDVHSAALAAAALGGGVGLHGDASVVDRIHAGLEHGARQQLDRALAVDAAALTAGPWGRVAGHLAAVHREAAVLGCPHAAAAPDPIPVGRRDT